MKNIQCTSGIRLLEGTGLTRIRFEGAGLKEHRLKEHRLKECGLEEYGLKEHRLKEYGLKEYGLKEHRLKEYGLKEHRLKEHGLKECGLKMAGLEKTGLEKDELEEIRLRKRPELEGILLLGAALAVILLCGFASGTFAAAKHTQAAQRGGQTVYESVRISEGDSLWSIAQEYRGTEDTAVFVEELKRLNGLSTDRIQAGSYILVPVISAP